MRLNPTGVGKSGADQHERTSGRCALRLVMVDSTCYGAVNPHPAGMAIPRAHRRKFSHHRSGLSLHIVSPAGYGAVVLDPACMEPPGAHGCEAIVTENCGTRGW